MNRCSSGCAGLNDVLGGGLPVGHFYLIEGEPGTGKTTLASQFVAEGIKRGERVLYVILSESRRELIAVARMHSLRIDEFVDMVRDSVENQLCEPFLTDSTRFSIPLRFQILFTGAYFQDNGYDRQP